MTEEEWRSRSFALLFITEAAKLHAEATGAEDIDLRRLQLAKAACLRRLGDDMPSEVQVWVARVDTTPDDAPWTVWDNMSLERPVYMAIRESYNRADTALKQRLAAAQDTFHGTDYYGYEPYLLEADDNHPTYSGPFYAAESAAHCDIIRCVFGNPFRPVAFDPVWRTPTATAIAATMYEARDFDAMPILADALEEAGCDSPDVLLHGREPGVHVRGCWVVDLVLGKA